MNADGEADPRAAGPGVVLPAGPLTAMAAVVLVLVGILALREVSGLVVPVVFGLFLALVASPLVGALERRGLRHSVALAGAIALLVAIVALTAGVIAYSLGELVVQIPRYEDRVRLTIDEVRELLAGVGISADPAAITSVISPEALASFVRPVASAVSGTGAALFVLAFTMIYALADTAGLRARAEAAFGPAHPIISGVQGFGVGLRRYLLVRAQLGLFAGVLVFLLLFVLGVPFAALWGFLTFATSFVPNIGFIIALIPPMVLAFLEGGLVPAALVVGGFAVINVLQDHLLQPMVMGNELNLSPLVVFISIIVWAWVLGAAGALLAVPMTVGLVMIMEAFPGSRGIAQLLRNKLEPVQDIFDEPPPPRSDPEDAPPEAAAS